LSNIFDGVLEYLHSRRRGQSIAGGNDAAVDTKIGEVVVASSWSFRSRRSNGPRRTPAEVEMQDPADPSALALMPDRLMVSAVITTAEKYI